MKIQKAALATILLVGVVLTVFPIATNMFGKTGGVEKLTGDFRSAFAPSAVEQTRTDLDGIVAMSDELQTKTLPALPEALGQTPDEFSAFMTANFPDVAAGIPQLNPIISRFDGIVSGFEAQASNFRKADTIPSSSMSSRVVPYLFLVPGVLLIGLAAAGLARGSSRAPKVALVASVVVGLGLAGGALGLSVHAKGQAVDDMTAAFGPVFTDAGVAQMDQDMNVIEAMAAQLQAETLPGLAKGLGMTPEAFNTFMGDNFPDVAAGVGSLDTVLPKFRGIVDGIGANLDSFDQAANLPTAGMPATSLAWWLLLPGTLLVVVPLAAFASTRARSRAGSSGVAVEPAAV